MESKTLPLTLTVEAAAQALGIGRALAYSLARSGELPAIRLGRRLVIPRQAIQRMLERKATEPVA